jgi:hypothetical protein
MSSNVRTENIQTTIFSMISDFSGRRNTEGYDETRLIHIHRRNRAYVWSSDFQRNLCDSILKGYYIPPIICNSRHIDGHGERREVMDGGNRITTFQKILNGEVQDLTPNERQIIGAHPITMVVMRNLTNKEQREMFRRINKNVKVSDGQLYAMSEEDSPLVKEAVALLQDANYPLRARITETFFDTVNNDNSSHTHLENAIALISGTLNGIKYITKSYSKQEDMIENQDPIVRSDVVNILSKILSIFEQANLEAPVIDKRIKKSQWTVGAYIGPIIYDIHTNENIDVVVKKWKNYLVMVRKNVENAKEAIEIKGAQNINPDKLKRKSYKVEIFLKENRILSNDDLKPIKHTVLASEGIAATTIPNTQNNDDDDDDDDCSEKSDIKD